MSSRSPDGTVRPSIIDRLIDADPRSPADRTPGFGASVEMMKVALRRDIEWLLNTRRIAEPAPESFSELNQSVYHYGLPDFSALNIDPITTRQLLLRQIEQTIQTFEPRLTQVRVVAAEGADETKRQLRFVIEGMLRMEPNPERVVFDTVLESASGKIKVEPDRA